MRSSSTLIYARKYDIFYKVRGYIKVEIRHFVEGHEGRIVMLQPRAYYKQMGSRSLGLNLLTKLARDGVYGCRVEVYKDGYTLYFKAKEKK